ncbi:hypothetical protein HDV05_006952 [Chytridiales sp. JEL 0842]|nr:hypothetical protein HDV05_006952 [Chytridiales sp. JEL 0842]
MRLIDRILQELPPETRVWDSKTKLDPQRTVHDRKDTLIGVSWNPSGTILASMDSSGKVALWSSENYVNQWKAIHVFNVKDPVLDLEWSHPQLQRRRYAPQNATPFDWEKALAGKLDNENVDLTMDGASALVTDPHQYVNGLFPLSPSCGARDVAGFALVVLTVYGQVIAYIEQTAGTVISFEKWLPQFDPQVTTDIFDECEERPILEAGCISFTGENQLFACVKCTKVNGSSLIHQPVELDIPSQTINWHVQSEISLNIDTVEQLYASQNPELVVLTTTGVQVWDRDTAGGWEIKSETLHGAASCAKHLTVFDTLESASDTSRIAVVTFADNSVSCWYGKEWKAIELKQDRGRKKIVPQFIGVCSSPNGVFAGLLYQQKSGGVVFRDVVIVNKTFADVESASSWLGGMFTAAFVGSVDTCDLVVATKHFASKFKSNSLPSLVFTKTLRFCDTLSAQNQPKISWTSNSCTLSSTSTRLLSLQRTLFKAFPSYSVLVGNAHLRLQIHVVIEALLSVFKNPGLAKTSLDNFLQVAKPDFEGGQFADSLYIEKGSLHHLCYLIKWSFELFEWSLKMFFSVLHSQVKAGGTSKGSFLTSANPVTLLFLHSPTRRALMMLIFIIKFIGTNIALFMVPPARLPLNSMIQPTFAPAEILYLQILEETINKAELKLEAVGNFLAEIGVLLDGVAAKHSRNVVKDNEAMFATGLAPECFSEILDDLKKLLDESCPKLFPTVAAQIPPNPALQQPGLSFPKHLAVLAPLLSKPLPLWTLFPRGFTNCMPECSWPPSAGAVPKVSAALDIVTKAAIHVQPLQPFKQCTDCYELSSVSTWVNASASDPVLEAFMKVSPFAGKYESHCICGGLWKLITIPTNE